MTLYIPAKTNSFWNGLLYFKFILGYWKRAGIKLNLFDDFLQKK